MRLYSTAYYVFLSSGKTSAHWFLECRDCLFESNAFAYMIVYVHMHNWIYFSLFYSFARTNLYMRVRVFPLFCRYIRWSYYPVYPIPLFNLQESVCVKQNHLLLEMPLYFHQENLSHRNPELSLSYNCKAYASPKTQCRVQFGVYSL